MLTLEGKMMNITVFSFAVLGLLTSITGVVVYMMKVKKNQTPKMPIGLLFSLLLGIVISGYSLMIAASSSLLSIVATSVPFALSAFIGVMFSFLLLQKKPPLGDIKVKVGDKLLSFESQTSLGVPFSDDNLKGKRTLLKFFRGSWCPYCSAELQMFDEMLPELETYGIQVVALSADTVTQANTHQLRDNLSLTLLSDSELHVVRAYGVEHHKAVSWDSENMRTFFGISFSMNPFQYRSMPIPTSLLIDEEGIIQWIDQSDDYRLRASHENVMSAIEQSFKTQ